MAAKWSPCFRTSAPQKQLGPAAGSLAKMLVIKGGRYRNRNSGTLPLTVLSVQETDPKVLEPTYGEEGSFSGV